MDDPEIWELTKVLGVVALVVLIAISLAYVVSSEKKMKDYEQDGNATFDAEMEDTDVVLTFEGSGAPEDVHRAVLLGSGGDRFRWSVLPRQESVTLKTDYSGRGLPDGGYQVLIVDHDEGTIAHASFRVETHESEWWPL